MMEQFVDNLHALVVKFDVLMLKANDGELEQIVKHSQGQFDALHNIGRVFMCVPFLGGTGWL